MGAEHSRRACCFQWVGAGRGTLARWRARRRLTAGAVREAGAPALGGRGAGAGRPGRWRWEAGALALGSAGRRARGQGARTASVDPERHAQLPKANSAPAVWEIEHDYRAQLPERSPGDRIWEVEQGFRRPPAPPGHSPPPRSSPGRYLPRVEAVAKFSGRPEAHFVGATADSAGVLGEGLSLGSAPVVGSSAAAVHALGWGGRGAGVRPTSGHEGGAHSRVREPEKHAQLPKANFGPAVWEIEPEYRAQLPERSPGDRVWEVEQVFRRPPAPPGHTPARQRSPRHSPEVGHPVPDLPSTKRGRRRLQANDGCATR